MKNVFSRDEKNRIKNTLDEHNNRTVNKYFFFVFLFAIESWWFDFQCGFPHTFYALFSAYHNLSHNSDESADLSVHVYIHKEQARRGSGGK